MHSQKWLLPGQPRAKSFEWTVRCPLKEELVVAGALRNIGEYHESRQEAIWTVRRNRDSTLKEYRKKVETFLIFTNWQADGARRQHTRLQHLEPALSFSTRYQGYPRRTRQFHGDLSRSTKRFLLLIRFPNRSSGIDNVGIISLQRNGF